MDIRATWHNLQPREQHLLQVAAGLILLLMAYSLIIEPFASARAILSEDLVARQQLLQTVNGAVLEKQRLGGAVSGGASRIGSNEELLRTIRETAKQQQLADNLRTAQPKGRNTIVVRFAGASFDAVNTWLHSLVQQYGISVQSLHAEDKGHTGNVDLEVELGR